MVRINDNFIKLPSSYLFSEVARKVKVLWRLILKPR